MKHRMNKIEDEAKMYNNRLNDYNANFTEEKNLFESMLSKVENSFIEIQ